MAKKEFVKMTKDQETIDVSPLVVENHKQLGWKVVGEESVAAETAPDAEQESGSKRRQRARSARRAGKEKQPTESVSGEEE